MQAIHSGIPSPYLSCLTRGPSTDQLEEQVNAIEVIVPEQRVQNVRVVSNERLGRIGRFLLVGCHDLSLAPLLPVAGDKTRYGNDLPFGGDGALVTAWLAIFKV